MTRLDLTDLACRRGGRLLFTGLTASVSAGQILHIKGSNGCGKSSLLRVIAGLSPPWSGSQSVSGDEGEVEPKDCLYLVEEVAALKPAETMAESLLFWARLMGLDPSRYDLIAAANAVDMAPLLDIETRTFSTGQRRRATLARLAIAHHQNGGRPIWLLDEPMNGLDAAARDKVKALIDAHVQTGGILIVASHDTEFHGATRINLDDYRPDPAAFDPSLFDDDAEQGV